MNIIETLAYFDTLIEGVPDAVKRLRAATKYQGSDPRYRADGREAMKEILAAAKIVTAKTAAASAAMLAVRMSGLDEGQTLQVANVYGLLPQEMTGRALPATK